MKEVKLLSFNSLGALCDLVIFRYPRVCMKTPVLVSVFSIAIACSSSLAMAETAPSSKRADDNGAALTKGKSKDLSDYFSGTFVSVEPAKTMNNRIHRAIESVVGRMSIFTKGKARSNLRNLTKPCMNFSFELDNKDSVIKCEDRDENTAPVSGKKIRLTSKDGHDYQLSHVFDDDNAKVTQTFFNKNGNREDVYEFIDGGERLVVHTRITSKWLSRDVRYALYFERDASKAAKSTQSAKK